VRFHRNAALALVVAIALSTWRGQLWIVARPGEQPRALLLEPLAMRRTTRVDAVLPAVPVGMERVRAGGEPLLIHYWAPWEHDALTQVTRLDSLRRLPELERLRVVVVCFDPFPSVARYVARQRLRLPVLLDAEAELRKGLPCPSLPYTYGIDAAGRVAIAQPGEVDWWDLATRAALARLVAESGSRRPVPRGSETL